jgi:hypothetical protein
MPQGFFVRLNVPLFRALVRRGIAYSAEALPLRKLDARSACPDEVIRLKIQE